MRYSEWHDFTNPPLHLRSVCLSDRLSVCLSDQLSVCLTDRDTSGGCGPPPNTTATKRLHLARCDEQILNCSCSTLTKLGILDKILFLHLKTKQNTLETTSYPDCDLQQHHLLRFKLWMAVNTRRTLFFFPSLSPSIWQIHWLTHRTRRINQYDNKSVWFNNSKSQWHQTLAGT